MSELADTLTATADARLRAADEALAAGDEDQARELAVRLAAVLDDAGRPEEAEKAWKRFSGE